MAESKAVRQPSRETESRGSLTTMASLPIFTNAILNLSKAFPQSSSPYLRRSEVSRIYLSTSRPNHDPHGRYAGLGTRRDSDTSGSSDVDDAYEVAKRAKERAEVMEEKIKDAVAKAAEKTEEIKEKAKQEAREMEEKTKRTAEMVAERAKEGADKAAVKAHDVKVKAEDTAGTAEEKAKEGASKVAETAQSVGEKAKQTVQEAWGAAKETTQKIKETVTRMSEEDDADDFNEDHVRKPKKEHGGGRKAMDEDDVELRRKAEGQYDGDRYKKQ